MLSVCRHGNAHENPRNPGITLNKNESQQQEWENQAPVSPSAILFQRLKLINSRPKNKYLFTGNEKRHISQGRQDEYGKD